MSEYINTAAAISPVAEAQRGFRPLYYTDTVNHCPGCGHSAWHIGRVSAECAHCETAIPLAHVNIQSAHPIIHHSGSSRAMAA